MNHKVCGETLIKHKEGPSALSFDTKTGIYMYSVTCMVSITQW